MELKQMLNMLTKNQYCITFEHETEYSCDTNGLYCEDYCRCGQIVDTKVTGFPDIYSILHKCRTSEDFYFVIRIALHHGYCDPSKWKVNVVEGYYGQETDGCLFLDPKKMSEDILKLEGMEFSDKVKFVLNLEYGFLPEHIAKLKFRIETILMTRVIVPFWKIKPHTIEIQNNEPIRGVVRQVGSKYAIIDGHHRLVANINDKTVKVIVGDY